MKKMGLKNRCKESGQFMVEAILLMTLFLGIAVVLKKKFHEENILGLLVAKPWSQISGMMSHGSWKPERFSPSVHPQGSVLAREGDQK